MLIGQTFTKLSVNIAQQRPLEDLVVLKRQNSAAREMFLMKLRENVNSVLAAEVITIWKVVF